jgi:hypothetical protein
MTGHLDTLKDLVSVDEMSLRQNDMLPTYTECVVFIKVTVLICNINNWTFGDIDRLSVCRRDVFRRNDNQPTSIQ